MGGNMKKKSGKTRKKMKRRTKIFLFVNFIAFAFAFMYLTREKSNFVPEPSKGKISIASFNIQIFGTSKLGKKEIMDRIVEIIKNFDIVAIQEVRSTNDKIIPTLIGMLGENWDYRISKRLGRTNSKEQYALVFKKSIVIVDSVYQVLDPEDRLHREPFVCYCRSGNFDFSIINIHTDPDEVPQEMNALDDILKNEIKKENDAILLGDLNASPSEFEELGDVPGIISVIPDGVFTNVRGNKTYDNIVFLKDKLKEFIRGDVYNFRSIFDLSQEQALEISDHLPVFAIFRTDMNDDDGILAMNNIHSKRLFALIHK